MIRWQMIDVRINIFFIKIQIKLIAYTFDVQHSEKTGYSNCIFDQWLVYVVIYNSTKKGTDQQPNYYNRFIIY